MRIRIHLPKKCGFGYIFPKNADPDPHSVCNQQHSSMNSYLYLVAGEEDEYSVWDGLADAEDQASHLVLKAQRFRVPVRRVQIPACTAGINTPRGKRIMHYGKYYSCGVIERW
jgi:hypothetical protein